MQINNKLYNPEIHDLYKGLTVKQPYADLLTKAVFRDEKGIYHAQKTIEVRTRKISYRGDILICSSAKPVLDGRLSGVTCGLVELYDVKPVEEFTAEDWEQTCIPENERMKHGYGWIMRNPRRVIEMPCKGQLGLYDFVTPKGDIVCYPQNLALGNDGWEIIKKRLEQGK